MRRGTRRNVVGAVVALALVAGSFAVAHHVAAAGDYRFSIDDVTVTEAPSGVARFIVTVTPAPAANDSVKVQYCTTDGTATAPDDYTAAPPGASLPPSSGGCAAASNSWPSLTFGPGGSSTRTFDVEVIDDDVAELMENFTVNLKNPTAASCAAPCSVGLTDATGNGTILDNEPGLTINDVSKLEGDGGNTPFTFMVTSTKPAASGCPITVPFFTSDGTANSGFDRSSDYAPTSGDFTIPAGGTTSDTKDVAVYGDMATENDETFNVNLGTPSVPTGFPSNCASPPRVLKSSGVGTIRTDDGGAGGPALSVSNGKPKKATTKSDCRFVILITPMSPSAVTVDFTTSGAEKQIAAAAGTLTFAPGATGTAVKVDVVKRRRKNTKFDVVLSNATGATISDDTGTCTIKKKKKKR